MFVLDNELELSDDIVEEDDEDLDDADLGDDDKDEE